MNPEFSAEGEALDISRAGIGVSLPVQFPPESYVQVQVADTTLHGFIMYSREWSPSSRASFARNKVWISGATEAFPDRPFYQTGIEVIEATIGTSGLSQLLRATLEEVPDLEITYSG